MKLASTIYYYFRIEFQLARVPSYQRRLREVLLDSQLRFYDYSVSEIINTLSETFTTGEKEQFKERVMVSSQRAKVKFGK